jgi:hypothetical protein
MISHVLEHTKPCCRADFTKFSTTSGAEIWLQEISEQELIGFNPHFAGKSATDIYQSHKRESRNSTAVYAWANPKDEAMKFGRISFVFDAQTFFESNFTISSLRTSITALPQRFQFSRLKRNMRRVRRAEIKIRIKSFSERSF